MRILLDTHLLLWALSTPGKLSRKARATIDRSHVFVSAASIWEVAVKNALGKLAADPHEVLAAVKPAGFEFLPVSPEHAAHVGDLPALHRDPFDRLLVAQARLEPMTLVTNDGPLAAYGPFVLVV